MIKIEDLLLVAAIPIGRRRSTSAALSGLVDTVHPTTFAKAGRAVVLFRRVGVTNGGLTSAGVSSNANLRIGIRSASASTASYTTASLLPTTVSATALSVSGATYAYNIKLDGVKRYLSVYMSNAGSSATHGCDVLLSDWGGIPVTQPKATTASSRYGFTSLTHIPSNP
jgi:hypothetical protein